MLGLLWNLTKEKLTGKLTPRHTPELMQLLEDHEAAAAAGGRHPVGTDELMVRWINHHIGTYMREHTDQQELPNPNPNPNPNPSPSPSPSPSPNPNRNEVDVIMKNSRFPTGKRFASLEDAVLELVRRSTILTILTRCIGTRSLP